MFSELFHALLGGLAAFVCTLGLTRLMIFVGPKLGLLDLPNARCVHVIPVPRAGGIAIWLGFLCVGLMAGHFFPWTMDGQIGQNLSAFLSASGVLMVVGFIDDRRGMPALVKLGGQISAALIFFVMSADNSSNILGIQVPIWMECAAFVGWTVLLINAFNLIDGLDGLCGGLACISLLVIALIEMAHGDVADALLTFVMLGAVGGFLRYNLHPAKIFLGDAGSMLLGFFLATSATMSGGKMTVAGSILMPLAVAGVPLLDVLLAIWRRSARSTVSRWSGKGRVGVFAPDKDHIHHRLLARGLNQRRVALLLHVLAAFLALLAFVPMLIGPRGLAVTACGILLIALFGLRHLAQVELMHTGSLVYMGIKRRSGPHTKRKWYFLYDLLVSLFAASFAMFMETNAWTRNGDVEMTLRFVTVFVTCEMITLHILRIYRRVWSRADLREFALVSMGIIISGGFAATAMQASTMDLAWVFMRASLIAVSISMALHLLPRAFPEIMRELAVDSYHRRLTTRKNGGKQILVYGAGDIGNLLIEHLKNCQIEESHRFQISGFLDDSQAMWNRTVNGFVVFGNLDALPKLAESFHLHGVMVAIRRVSPERMEQLRRLAEELKLALYEWPSDFTPTQLSTSRKNESHDF